MSKQPDQSLNSSTPLTHSNPQTPGSKKDDFTTSTSQTWTIKKKKKKKCTCKGFSSSGTIKKYNKNSESELIPWLREAKKRKEFMKKHMRDLRNCKPTVDDKPPKLNVSSLYDQELLSSIRSDLKGRFDANIAIVKSLFEVCVKRGKTDTFSFNYDKPKPTNYLERKKNAQYIENHNVAMSNILKKPGPTLVTVKKHAEEWKRMESIMESLSEFPLFWKIKNEKNEMETILPPPNVQQYITEKSSKYSDKRPRVFFEVSIKGFGVVGKMVAILYSDFVPITVKNFLNFCNSKNSLTYKGNSFYLIFQNYYCQTGDVVENHGFGGTSIYGPYFKCENFSFKHDSKGVLTMHQRIPNRNDSQFLITFRKLESLDGKNVAFGKIVKGLHVLEIIESLGSKKTGRPKNDIFISDCDEI